MDERNVIEILGRNVHDVRCKKNMSIQELAEKLNLEIDVLIKVEAEEYSGLNILQHIQIAKALGVNYEEITKGIKFVED